MQMEFDLSELPHKILTVDEVAHCFRVHPITIRRWEKQGQLKSCRIGPKKIIRFMKEDIFNALLIYYNLEAVRLARSAEAEAIVDMVESAYPNSTVRQVFNLKAIKDYDRSGSLLDNLSLENADRILIRTFIDVPKWSKRLNIYYLKKYKDMENPDSVGLYWLYKYYQKVGMLNIYVNQTSL